MNEQFDNYDIPYDVLWLDIEHTNGKRYLTWDTAKFPTPKNMQDNLMKTGRKVGVFNAMRVWLKYCFENECMLYYCIDGHYCGSPY